MSNNFVVLNYLDKIVLSKVLTVQCNIDLRGNIFEIRTLNYQ